MTRIGLVVGLLCNLIDDSVGKNNDKLSSGLCVKPTMDIRSYGTGLVQVYRTEHAL